MHGKTKAKTPAEYFNGLEEPRKSALKKIHALIRKHAPNLKPQIHSGMVGYGLYHYIYASGREGDWPYISMANQKHYMALYFCMADGTTYLAESNKKHLPNADIGKSCVRFKKLEDLDLKVIERMVKKTAVFAKKNKVYNAKSKK